MLFTKRRNFFLVAAISCLAIAPCISQAIASADSDPRDNMITLLNAWVSNDAEAARRVATEQAIKSCFGVDSKSWLETCENLPRASDIKCDASSRSEDVRCEIRPAKPQCRIKIVSKINGMIVDVDFDYAPRK